MKYIEPLLKAESAAMLQRIFEQEYEIIELAKRQTSLENIRKCKELQLEMSILTRKFLKR